VHRAGELHACRVQGRVALRSLRDAPGPIDLAVVAVPADAVRAVLEVSGVAGVQREADLRAWLRDQPRRVVGPNCLGWIRPPRHLNLTMP
jgi:acyl-CoA synthetase (NDP forming)